MKRTLVRASSPGIDLWLCFRLAFISSTAKRLPFRSVLPLCTMCSPNILTTLFHFSSRKTCGSKWLQVMRKHVTVSTIAIAATAVVLSACCYVSGVPSRTSDLMLPTSLAISQACGPCEQTKQALCSTLTSSCGCMNDSHTFMCTHTFIESF